MKKTPNFARFLY